MSLTPTLKMGLPPSLALPTTPSSTKLELNPLGFPLEIAKELQKRNLLATTTTCWKNETESLLATSFDDLKCPARRCLVYTQFYRHENKGETKSKELTTRIFFDQNDEWYLTVKDIKDIQTNSSPEPVKALTVLVKKVEQVVNPIKSPLAGINGEVSGSSLSHIQEYVPDELSTFFSKNDLLAHSCYTWKTNKNEKFKKKVASLSIKMRPWEDKKWIEYTMNVTDNSLNDTTSMKWFFSEGKLVKHHFTKITTKQHYPHKGLASPSTEGIKTALELIKKVPLAGESLQVDF